MRFRAFVFLCLGLLGLGCSTTPKVTDVGAVTAAPEAYRNKLVEVFGEVVNYEAPAGDVIRTWAFTVESTEGTRLDVYTDNRAAEDIAAAERLVREARERGEAIWVVGYLRVGKYKSVTAGPRLDLRQVRYGERVVKLDSRRDPYSDSPRFHFGVGYYRGFHDLHHHHYQPYYW